MLPIRSEEKFGPVIEKAPRHNALEIKELTPIFAPNGNQPKPKRQNSYRLKREDERKLQNDHVQL